MKNISFKKLCGAGNDFVLLDLNHNPDLELKPDIVKSLCDRRYGVGSDGLLAISDSKDHDFFMQYFNADGYPGSLCGNGARCALRYGFESGRAKNTTADFICGDESYSGENLDNINIKFNLAVPTDLRKEFLLNILGMQIKSAFIDTGSPHVVVNINDVPKLNDNPELKFSGIEDFPTVKIGREIRHSAEFKKGTNVNFIELKEDKVFIRTFERGVEDETLACGTGSVASAMICAVNYNLKPPFTLVTGGGDELIVNFVREENKFSNISLTGPAKIVYSGEIILNT